VSANRGSGHAGTELELAGFRPETTNLGAILGMPKVLRPV
jgi:hypothetical protein